MLLVQFFSMPLIYEYFWVNLRRMDRSSTTRIDVRVCAYSENVDDGSQVWHPTRHVLKVIDKDLLNFRDFGEELSEEIKHGRNQKLCITFWDKVSNLFTEINHDTL